MEPEITGVMWTARLMALKAGGVDRSLSTTGIISAIHYAIAKGARVINASFIGPECSLAFYDAVSAANDAGILFVAAAGNGGNDGIGDDNDNVPNFPSNFSAPSVCDGHQIVALTNVIAVAATDQNDQLATFSNFGSTTVQVAAPGSESTAQRPHQTLGLSFLITSTQARPGSDTPSGEPIVPGDSPIPRHSVNRTV
jgi:subtilisin family serine protease